MIKRQIAFSVLLTHNHNSVNLKLILPEGIIMTGRGINTVRIGDEVKHITELDALTLMHEWSKLTKENADLYDYNRQVNRGWRGNPPEKPVHE
ncbi:TPA: hypothetical protein ACWLWV_005199 [Klebsiella pneumoniae]